jgi:hypothetical protein
VPRIGCNVDETTKRKLTALAIHLRLYDQAKALRWAIDRAFRAEGLGADSPAELPQEPSTCDRQLFVRCNDVESAAVDYCMQLTKLAQSDVTRLALRYLATALGAQDPALPAFMRDVMLGGGLVPEPVEQCFTEDRVQRCSGCGATDWANCPCGVPTVVGPITSCGPEDFPGSDFT